MNTGISKQRNYINYTKTKKKTVCVYLKATITKNNPTISNNTMPAPTVLIKMERHESLPDAHGGELALSCRGRGEETVEVAPLLDAVLVGPQHLEVRTLDPCRKTRFAVS